MHTKRLKYKDFCSWKKKKGRLPLIVRGARQVGKTYLIKYFAEKNYKNWHYFNFEKNKAIHKAFEADLSPDLIISQLEFLTDKKILVPLQNLWAGEDSILAEQAININS